MAAVSGFVLAVVVARGTDAEGTGLFFEAVAIFTIAVSVTSLGADTGLLRSLSRLTAMGRTADLRRCVWIALTPVVATCVVISLLALYWSDALVNALMSGSSAREAEPYLLVCIAFLIVGATSTVLVQATRGLGSVRPYVALQNIGLPVVRVLLVLIAVVVLSPWSIPLAWALPLVPAAVGAAVALRQEIRRAESQHRSSPSSRTPISRLAKEFWAFALLRGLAAAVDLTLVWLDVILVGILLGTVEAGIYAAASRFVTTGTLVLQAMRLAIAPRISQFLSTAQQGRAATLYRSATAWVVTTSWPLYLIMACFSGTLLSLFGAEFRAGSTAMTILALAMLVNLATGNVGTVLLMGGKSGWALSNKVVALTANVALNLVLIPRFGIAGAAIAWAVAIALDNLLAMTQVRRLLAAPAFDRATAVAAATACVWVGGAALAVRLSFGDDVLAMALSVAVGGVLYLLALRRNRELLGLDHFLRLPRELLGQGRSRERQELS